MGGGIPSHGKRIVSARIGFSQGGGFAPGPIFSVQLRYRNCMRLNFGYASIPQIREGIHTLAVLLQAHSAKSTNRAGVRELFWDAAMDVLNHAAVVEVT